MSLVSVVIPAFNCERYIGQALTSILQQTHNDLEVLICDDCSTDNTWAILNNFRDSRIRLFKNKTNEGVVSTRNFLFAQASGDFLLIQDADDWSEKNRVEVMLRFFTENPGVNACASNHFRVDNVGGTSHEHKDGPYSVTLSDGIDLPFMPCTLIVSRVVYQTIGGYDPFFAGLFAEDWYWVIRILERFQLVLLSEPLYYYRFNPTSITNTFAQRKSFVVPELMRELLEQRMNTGTDWVEQSNGQAISDFCSKLFSDRKWLSEKFRVAAAVQRDGKKRKLALKLIGKALRYNPFGYRNFVTLRYVLS